MFPPSWNNYLLFSSKSLCDLTWAYVLILFPKPVLLNSSPIYQLKFSLSFRAHSSMQPLRKPQWSWLLTSSPWVWAGPSDSFLMNIGMKCHSWDLIAQRLWRVSYSCSLVSLGRKLAAILGAMLWRDPDGMDLRKAFSPWAVGTLGSHSNSWKKLGPASHYVRELEGDSPTEEPAEETATQIPLW